MTYNVIITIPKINLTNVTVISMSYVLSYDMDFREIVHEVHGDKINKESKMFVVERDVYYKTSMELTINNKTVTTPWSTVKKIVVCEALVTDNLNTPFLKKIIVEGQLIVATENYNHRDRLYYSEDLSFFIENDMLKARNNNNNLNIRLTLDENNLLSLHYVKDMSPDETKKYNFLIKNSDNIITESTTNSRGGAVVVEENDRKLKNVMCRVSDGQRLSKYSNLLICENSYEKEPFDIDIDGDFKIKSCLKLHVRRKDTDINSFDVLITDIYNTPIVIINNSVSNNITIETESLKANVEYYLYIRCNFNNGKRSSYKLLKKGLAYGGFLSIEEIGMTNTNGINAVNTEIMSCGNFIYSDFFSNTLSLFRLYDNKIIKIKELVNLGIELFADFINILNVTETIKVVNYSDKDNRSHWVKYIFDKNLLELTEVGRFSFENERGCSSVNNSASYLNNIIYYIPEYEHDSDGELINLSLYGIDIGSFTRTKIKVLPVSSLASSSLFTLDNELFIYGGCSKIVLNSISSKKKIIDNFTIYKFIDNNFVEFSSIPSDYINNCDCLHSHVNNGDIIFTNSSYGCSGSVDSFIFDKVKKEFHSLRYKKKKSQFRTNIYDCNNLYRISNNVFDSQVMVKYSKASSDKIDYDKDSYDLVVSDGGVVTVEDVTAYSKIIILGNGILKVIKNGLKTIYTSEDLLITSDTEISSGLLNSYKSNNIHIFNSVLNIVDIVCDIENGSLTVKDLIVNIDDIMTYDKVFIEGSGLLRFYDNGIVREYNRNDLIITRESDITDRFNNSYERYHFLESPVNIKEEG